MMMRSSITRQILLLVTGAVLITTATFVAMALFGPPPVAAPVFVEQVVDALRKGRSPPDPVRRLVVTHSASAPAISGERRRDAVLERMLAAMAGAKPGDIQVYVAEGRLALSRPPPLQPGGANRPGMPAMGGRLHPQTLPGDFVILRRVGDDWLKIQPGPDMAVNRWRMMAAIAVGIVLAFVGSIAWFVARRITRPLRALSSAARSATMGHIWSPDLPGATREVREVADALAMFDARHRDHFRQQTAMLASVAHDLGTPLARLAFRVESLPEAQRQAAIADIEQMRRLVAAGLALARGDVSRREHFDLGMLAARIGKEAGLAPSAISLSESALPIEGEPVAIERLVQNLLDNSLRHGGGGRLSVRRAGGWASLAVEDDGPGFPPQLLAIVCDPFVRGGGEVEGSGLGLAIARAVAERHGGSLSVGNRPQGGARVEALFPLAS